MNKIYIIHENDDWTSHLINRLEELNIDYESWHLFDGVIDLNSNPPNGIFYNRMSASSHTRGNRYSPELASNLIKWLESNNRIVINGGLAIELEISKIKQYIALKDFGIKYPKTIAAIGINNIIESAKKIESLPFILKHNRAGKGLGTRLINSISELDNYLNSNLFENSIDGIVLVQEYLKSIDNCIYRLEFINSKFFYCVKIIANGGFELCPADGCTIDNAPIFEIVDCPINENDIKKYEDCIKANNIDICAIEFILTKNGAYAFDINTNTNYNNTAEINANKFSMLEIAKYLGSLR